MPAGAGYRVYVYYRATSGDPWSIYGMSSGTVDVTASFNSISVTAPTGTSSQAQGGSLPVTWTTNQTVASGQFSLWVVSPSNGWYVGKIVNADGTGSYANSVTLNVPVDTGYRIFVYYRATTGDPWGIYGMSPGTVNVTAVFNAITVTAPTGSTSHAQGSSLAVTWTTNQTVASGQFSLWVVSPSNGWYVGKIVNADGTAGYCEQRHLERARRHRLPHLRLLPRHHGRPLGHLRDEPRDSQCDRALREPARVASRQTGGGRTSAARSLERPAARYPTSGRLWTALGDPQLAVQAAAEGIG